MAAAECKAQAPCLQQKVRPCDKSHKTYQILAGVSAALVPGLRFHSACANACLVMQCCYTMLILVKLSFACNCRLQYNSTCMCTCTCQPEQQPYMPAMPQLPQHPPCPAASPAACSTTTSTPQPGLFLPSLHCWGPSCSRPAATRAATSHGPAAEKEADWCCCCCLCCCCCCPPI